MLIELDKLNLLPTNLTNDTDLYTSIYFYLDLVCRGGG